MWGACFVAIFLDDTRWHNVKNMGISRGKVDQSPKILLCSGVDLNCIIESSHHKLFCGLIVGAAIDIPEVMCTSPHGCPRGINLGKDVSRMMMHVSSHYLGPQLVGPM